MSPDILVSFVPLWKIYDISFYTVDVYPGCSPVSF